MSSMLVGIIGVIVFIGLAVAGSLLLGARFSDAKTDSEAARYMSEGAQISRAYELYGVNEGQYPTGETSDDKIQQMIDGGYLKGMPEGGLQTPGYSTTWYIDDARGAALTFIGEDSKAGAICAAARRQAGFTDPVKQCDASDIANNDPCCISG